MREHGIQSSCHDMFLRVCFLVLFTKKGRHFPDCEESFFPDFFPGLLISPHTRTRSRAHTHAHAHSRTRAHTYQATAWKAGHKEACRDPRPSATNVPDPRNLGPKSSIASSAQSNSLLDFMTSAQWQQNPRPSARPSVPPNPAVQGTWYMAVA